MSWKHRVTCLLTATVLISALSSLARAAAPVEIFGLAGGKPSEHERDVTRNNLEKEVAAKRQSLKTALKAMEKPDSTKERLATAKALETQVGALEDTIAAHDWLKSKNEMHWLPHIDAAFRIVGEGNLAERLTPSGNLFYQVPLRGAANTHIVVVGNLGTISALTAGTSADSLQEIADQLRNSSEGLSVGLQPYYVLSDKPSRDVSLVPQAILLGRLKTVKATDGSSVDFGSFAMGLGATLGFGAADEGEARPISLTMNAVYSVFSPFRYHQLFGVQRDHQWDGQLRVLLPIASGGTGIAVETIATPHLLPVWQARIVFLRRRKG